MDLPFYREYNLPWTSTSGQERKFRRLLAIFMAVTFFLGLVWPWIPTPEKDPYEVDEIPPRIAKLLLEQQAPPPPPPNRNPNRSRKKHHRSRNLHLSRNPRPSRKLISRPLRVNRPRLRCCHLQKTLLRLRTVTYLNPSPTIVH